MLHSNWTYFVEWDSLRQDIIWGPPDIINHLRSGPQHHPSLKTGDLEYTWSCLKVGASSDNKKFIKTKPVRLGKGRRIVRGRITLLYPSLSMRSKSKTDRIAERYERIGSENPTVGMASSWKRVTSFRNSANKKGRT